MRAAALAPLVLVLVEALTAGALLRRSQHDAGPHLVTPPGWVALCTRGNRRHKILANEGMVRGVLVQESMVRGDLSDERMAVQGKDAIVQISDKRGW